MLSAAYDQVDRDHTTFDRLNETDRKVQEYKQRQEEKKRNQVGCDSPVKEIQLAESLHYNGWEIGDFITKQNLTFYEGNVVKYICRHRKKDGLNDLIKARNYLNKVINEYNNTGT